MARRYFLIVVLLSTVLAACTDPIEQAGTVIITSSPTGANVVVEGKLMGTTPVRLEGIPEGPLVGTIERDGYVVSPFEVVVRSGQEIVVSQDLEPYLNVMLQSAVRFDDPRNPVHWLVVDAGIGAFDVVKGRSGPNFPISAYWSGLVAGSEQGQEYAERVRNDLMQVIVNDFAVLDSEDQVFGSISLWVVPDSHWTSRELDDQWAVVQLNYRGETPYSYVVKKDVGTGQWRLFRRLYDTERIEDLTLHQVSLNNEAFLYALNSPVGVDRSSPKSVASHFWRAMLLREEDSARELLSPRVYPESFDMLQLGFQSGLSYQDTRQAFESIAGYIDFEEILLRNQFLAITTSTLFGKTFERDTRLMLIHEDGFWSVLMPGVWFDDSGVFSPEASFFADIEDLVR